MEELKPYPFCGGYDLEPDAAGCPTFKNDEITEWINCNTCEASGPVGVNGSEAWNTRVKP